MVHIGRSEQRNASARIVGALCIKIRQIGNGAVTAVKAALVCLYAEENLFKRIITVFFRELNLRVYIAKTAVVYKYGILDFFFHAVAVNVGVEPLRLAGIKGGIRIVILRVKAC